jgi:hypothetical protein
MSDIVRVKSDFVRWGRTLSTGRSLETRTSPKNLPFLPKLDFGAIGPQTDEAWTHGSPQHKEQVPKEGFPQIQRFPFRFWMNSKTECNTHFLQDKTLPSQKCIRLYFGKFSLRKKVFPISFDLRLHSWHDILYFLKILEKPKRI